MRIKLIRDLLYTLFLVSGTAAIIYLSLNVYKKGISEPVYHIETAYVSRFVENNKIGFIDKEGHQVIPAQFDWATPFNYSLPVVVVCQGYQEIQIPGSEYQETAMQYGQWGAIDDQGHIIVPLEYDRFSLTKQGKFEPSKSILTFYKGSQAYELYYYPHQHKYMLKEYMLKEAKS